MTSKVLAIAGMHRSGTSLIAQYLGECGLFIGDELTNSKLNQDRSFYGGHHEDKEFSDFHKLILKKRFLSDFPTHSFRLPVRVGGEGKKQAESLIKTRESLPQWGWKDPRTTLFLDFWNEVIPDLKCLFLVRHPLSVVDSLLRRGNEKHISDRPINGLRVWKVYNQQVLNFWQKHPENSIICDVDALVHDPDRLRQGLVEKFSFDLKTADFSSIFSEKAFRMQPSEQVEKMKTQHSKEVEKILLLHQQLQEIAKEY